MSPMVKMVCMFSLSQCQLWQSVFINHFRYFFLVDVVFITHLVNAEKEDFVDSREVHIRPHETIADLRKKLSALFSRPENEIFMLVHKAEREISPIVLLGDEKNDMAVSSFNFPRLTKVSNLKYSFAVVNAGIL